MEGSGNFNVCVRVRPESSRETEDPRHRCILRVSDDMVFVSAKVAAPGPPRANTRNAEKQFESDRVYGEDTPTRDIFEGSVRPLVPGLLQGYSLTVFAYGATGSGKTYTMMGSDHSQPGINILTMSYLYTLITQREGLDTHVEVSYLEVYNETIRDLLVPDSRALCLREDPAKGVIIGGLSSRVVHTAEDVMLVLEEGRGRRVQASTLANDASSRSHAVLQVHIRTKDRCKGLAAEVREAKLSMVDLAGSERAALCNNEGIRLKEGANINRSLLALGNCINALASQKAAATTNPTATPTKKTHDHVPYRDSKLTRMLKDCLGGSCRALMIAAVSSSSMCYEDTYNTLRYASRARNIKVAAECRVAHVPLHVSEYRRLIADLQRENADLRDRLAHAPPAAVLAATHTSEDSPVGPPEEDPTAPLLGDLTALTERQIALRRSLLEAHKARHDTAIAAREQAVTLFRWKHGLGREAGPEPASIVHARTRLEACRATDAALEGELQGLRTALESAVCSFRRVADRIPAIKATASQRALLDARMQLHERTVEYYEQAQQCADARAAQYLQAAAVAEATLSIDEARDFIEWIVPRARGDHSVASEELSTRHERVTSWLRLHRCDLLTEVASMDVGSEGEVPPGVQDFLTGTAAYVNALQRPARRLSATSLCSTRSFRPGPLLKAQLTSGLKKSLPRPAPLGAVKGSNSKAVAFSTGPTARSNLQAERGRLKLRQLQDTPMLNGLQPPTPRRSAVPPRRRTPTHRVTILPHPTAPKPLPDGPRLPVAGLRKRKPCPPSPSDGAVSPTAAPPRPPPQDGRKDSNGTDASIRSSEDRRRKRPKHDGDAAASTKRSLSLRPPMLPTPGKCWVRPPPSGSRPVPRLASNEVETSDNEGPRRPPPSPSFQFRMEGSDRRSAAKRHAARTQSAAPVDAKRPDRIRAPLRPRCPNAIVRPRAPYPLAPKRSQSAAVPRPPPALLPPPPNGLSTWAMVAGAAKQDPIPPEASPRRAVPTKPTIAFAIPAACDPTDAVRPVDQRRRLEIARELRRRNRLTIAGGEFPHLTPLLPPLSL